MLDKKGKIIFEIVIVMMVLLLSIAIGNNSGKEKVSTNRTTSCKKITKPKEDNSTITKSKQKLNEQLKKEAMQDNIVDINRHTDTLKGKKVFAIGQISTADYKNIMDNFPSFTLNQKEDNGYGIYHITNILSIKELKDGDNVKIYGTVDGNAKDGSPKITATVIEKQ